MHWLEPISSVFKPFVFLWPNLYLYLQNCNTSQFWWTWLSRREQGWRFHLAPALLLLWLHLLIFLHQVLYGSSQGFHAVDLDSASVYDIYLPKHAQGPVVPHTIVTLPNTNGMQLLLCYDNEGVYVNTYGKVKLPPVIFFCPTSYLLHPTLQFHQQLTPHNCTPQ